MPINSQIDSSLGVIFSTFQGVVTKDDISEEVESFRTDPAFQPNFNHIIDTRGATRIDLSIEGMREVSLHTVFNEKSRRAIVAEEDGRFGIARMYELLRDAHDKPDQVQVFRTMAEARHWLGLDYKI